MVTIEGTRWEAVLDDGSVIAEGTGTRYAELPLRRLREFRLIHGGEVLFSTAPPEGASGENLRYRVRREAVEGEGVVAAYWLIGWAPWGPAYLIDPALLEGPEQAVWLSPQGFHDHQGAEGEPCGCGGGHPIGWFDAPAPMGEEA